MAGSDEIHIRGRAVSRGIGVGKAVCLFGGARQFFLRRIDGPLIEDELEHFAAAIETARAALLIEIGLARRERTETLAELLESHLLILEDPLLIDRIENLIRDKQVNAEWAISNVFDEFTNSLKAHSDSSFRGKYLDLEDAADRLLAAIGCNPISIQFPAKSIVASADLRASTVVKLRDSSVSGIITEHGGWTSHASILAREFGIPSVAGVRDIFKFVHDDIEVAVNGFTGDVFLHPGRSTISGLRKKGPVCLQQADGELDRANGQPKTMDGRIIAIRTNTVSVEAYRAAQREGAQGIGLYRSESLLGKYGRLPNEDEQAAEYSEIATAAGSDGVRIRLFDVDADAFPVFTVGRQKNPALGLRAIRLGFQKPELLIPQIRALLRASANGNVGMVVPMVTGTAEMIVFRKLVQEQALELESSGTPIGQPTIGSMIEVPSAAIVADQLARVSDFLCLGTNDLAQYVLAADRDNESVSEWFRTLHPAMLRLVRNVIESCRAAGKQLIVCGEMAGSPFYTPILIGMKATDLSMNPGSIRAVKRLISGIAYDEAFALVREIEAMTTPQEIEQTVIDIAKRKWAHLFAPAFLDQQIE